MTTLPEWLRLWVQQALLGEVYQSIRAIAIGWTEDRSLTLRYYLNRDPTEGDFESVSIVMTNILANTSSNEDIREAKTECILAEGRLRDVDDLSGFVYAQREYDTHEIE